MSGSGWEGVGGAVGRVWMLEDVLPTACHLPRPRSVSTRRACSSLVTRMRHPDTTKSLGSAQRHLYLTQTLKHHARAWGMGSWIWCSSGHPGTAGTHPLAPPRWAVVPSVMCRASLPAPASVLDTCGGRPSSRFRCACGWPRAAAPGAQDTSSSNIAPAAIRPMAGRCAPW